VEASLSFPGKFTQSFPNTNHTLITQRLGFYPHFNALNSVLGKYKNPILMCPHLNH